jgi:hypothetical protein
LTPAVRSDPAANIAQHFGNIGDGESLIGGDGINKTMVWKKCASLGNFAGAETFPTRHCRCHLRNGVFHFFT